MCTATTNCLSTKFFHLATYAQASQSLDFRSRRRTLVALGMVRGHFIPFNAGSFSKESTSGVKTSGDAYPSPYNTEATGVRPQGGRREIARALVAFERYTLDTVGWRSLILGPSYKAMPQHIRSASRC